MVILNEDRMGVRALRKFADGYRAKHCPVGVEVDPAKKVNEPWRRIANMTVEQEALLDRKERRAGIRALVKWIEAWVKEEGRISKDEVRGHVRGGKAIGIEGGFRSPHPGFASLISALSPAGREGTGSGVAVGTVSDEADEVWACEGQGRQMVEEVCRELNISKWQLGKLIREYRGITAAELIDGFRVRPVKAKIGELLKGYARELWLAPGLYVGVLLMDERLKVYGGGDSDYFVDPTEDFRKKELFETISERREDLLEKFDAGWKRGELSRDGFAVELGFRSFSELNRACLNVHGKTVRQLAWGIGCEIVDYYLAREQQELYALAFCPKGSTRIVRARYLYHGSAELPAGAVSRATLWDALDAAWRAEMGAWMETG